MSLLCMKNHKTNNLFFSSFFNDLLTKSKAKTLISSASWIGIESNSWVPSTLSNQELWNFWITLHLAGLAVSPSWYYKWNEIQTRFFTKITHTNISLLHALTTYKSIVMPSQSIHPTWDQSKISTKIMSKLLKTHLSWLCTFSWGSSLLKQAYAWTLYLSSSNNPGTMEKKFCSTF